MATLASLVVNLAAETASFRRSMEQAARTSNRHLGSISKSAGQMRTAVIGAFAAFAASRAIQSLIRTSDAMSGLNSRIKLASDSSESYRRTLDGLVSISNTYGQSLDSNAKLYTRLTQGKKQTTEQSQRLLGVTEAMAASLKISGASAAESASATLQLAQALGTGRFQGDEFRAVMESAPVFMNALADSLGVTTGELYKMKEAGELTTKVVIDAMLQKLPQLREQAEGIAPTFGAAFTRIRNSFGLLVASFDEGTGAFQALIGVINSIADALFFLVQKMPQFTAAWSDAWRTVTKQTEGSLDVLSNAIANFFDTLGRSIETSWTAIIATIPNTLIAMITTVGHILGGLLIVLDASWARAQNQAKYAWNAIIMVILSATATIEETVVKSFAAMFDGLGEGIKKAGRSVFDFGQTVGQVSLELGTSIANVGVSMAEMGQNLASGNAHVSSFRTSISALKEENIQLARTNTELAKTRDESINALIKETQEVWNNVTAHQLAIDGLEVNEVITRELSDAVEGSSMALQDNTTETAKNTKGKEKNAEVTDKAADAYRDYIAALADEYIQLTKSAREYEAYKLRLQGVNEKLVESALNLYDVVEAQRAMKEEAESAAETAKNAYENLADSIQNNLSDAFFNVFQKGASSIKQLFEQIKNWFFRLVADIIATKITINIVPSFGGLLGMGTASNALASVGQGGGFLSSLFNLGGNLFSGIGNIGANFGAGGLLSVLFGQSAGLAGSLGVLPTAGGALNAATSGLFGFGGTASIAGIASFAAIALPAIFLLSKLFKKNSIPKATAKILTDPTSGFYEILQNSEKHGANAAPLMDALESFHQSYSDTLEALGLGMNELVVEFHQRKNQFHALVGTLADPTLFFSKDVDIEDIEAVGDVVNKALLAAIAQSDTSEASSALAGFIEGLFIAGIENQGIENLEQGKAAEIVNWLLSIGEAAETASRTLPFLHDAIVGFAESGASVEDLTSFSGALIAIGAALDTTPFEDYESAVSSSNKTMMETLSGMSDSIMDMVSNFDGSAESAQVLAQSLLQYKDAATQAAAVIREMQTAISASAANLAERIRLDVMTQEEQHAYFMTRLEEVKRALESATDPEQILSLFEEFEKLTEAAWNTLTEEQKKQQRDIFLAMLEEGATIANERLDAATAILSEQFEQMSNAITLGMLEAFERAGLITVGAAEEFRKQIELALGTESAKLEEMVTFLTAALEGAGDLIGAAMVESAYNLLELLRDGGIDLAEALGMAGLSVEEALGLGSIELARILEEAGVDVSAILEAAGEESAGALLSAALAAAGALDRAADAIRDALQIGQRESEPGPTAAQTGFIGGAGMVGPDAIPLLVAQGEAVINRHQQAVVDAALQQSFGIGLKDLFSGSTPVHTAQAGYLPIGSPGYSPVLAPVEPPGGAIDPNWNEPPPIHPDWFLPVDQVLEPPEGFAPGPVLTVPPEPPEATLTVEEFIADLERRLNEALGNSIVNSITNLINQMNADLEAASSFGVDPAEVMAVFNAELQALLENSEITAEQLETLRAAFPELASEFDALEASMAAAAEAARALAAEELETELTRRLNELAGNEAINALSELTGWLEETLAQAAELGVSADLVNDVFGAELQALLDTLSIEQLEALRGAFPEFAEEIGNAIEDLMRQLEEEAREAQLIAAQETASSAFDILESAIEAEMRLLEQQFNEAAELARAQYDATIKALREDFEQEREAIIEGYSRAIDELRVSINSVEENLKTLNNLLNIVKNGIERLSTIAIPEVQQMTFQQALVELADLLALYNSQGGQGGTGGAGSSALDAERLSSLINTIASVPEELFATREDYIRARQVAANQLAELEEGLENEITYQEELLENMNSKLEALRQAQEAELEVLQQQLEADEAQAQALLDAALVDWRDQQALVYEQMLQEARDQLNALLGIETGVLSVEEALRRFQAALEALAAASEPGAASAMNRIDYRELKSSNDSAYSISGEIVTLNQEMRALKTHLQINNEEAKQLNIQIAKNNAKSTNILRRWEIDGMPAERTV